MDQQKPDEGEGWTQDHTEYSQIQPKTISTSSPFSDLEKEAVAEEKHAAHIEENRHVERGEAGLLFVVSG